MEWPLPAHPLLLNNNLIRMKHYYLAPCAWLLFTLSGFAQENSASAIVLTAQNWFAGTPTYTAGTLGSSASGLAVCNGVSEDDDVWYRFTATTQAAKIIVQNPAFDAVVQLFSNTMTTVACLNGAVANVTETMKVSGLIPGDAYFIRVHGLNNGSGSGTFNIAVQFYPTVQVQNSWSPYPNPDSDMTGYKINENTKRTTFSVSENALIQASHWRFVDTSNNQVHTKLVPGTSSLINLDVVGGLCFGKTYDVSVEIQVDNFWCGYNVVKQVITEAEPTTTLLPGFSGQYYPIDGNIKAVYVGNGQLLEWEFTTDQGTTVLYHQTSGLTGSFCYFNEIDCIRYNKIYSVRVRASLCSSAFGPWSPYYFVIVLPLPYTNVEPEHCNETLPDGATITCDFINVANQYAWQFAPIEPGDDDMIPIGPATVVYTPWTSCYLLPLGLTLDQSYRVGVKAFLGVGNIDGCSDPQEGDYGQFCPIHLVDFLLFSPGEEYLMPESEEETGVLALSDEKTVTMSRHAGQVFMTLKAGAIADPAMTTVRLYDLGGRVVFTHRCYLTPDIDLLQLPLGTDLPGGIYLTEMLTDSGLRLTDKIFLGSN